AYDTAWVARLAELDPAVGGRALTWLRNHQLSDGTWGTATPRYYHDRLISTLAAMTALAKYGQSDDRQRWQRAQVALNTIANGLLADPAGATIGFEMIAPTLLREAKEMKLLDDDKDGRLGRLEHYRAAKIAALPDGIINRFVTVAFSAEMAGPDGQHLLDVDNLQEANGSLGHSPSATAYFALHVRPNDAQAMEYLRGVVTDDGGVPDVAPFDVFERGWTLWNLSLLKSLDDTLKTACEPHLTFLEDAWHPTKGTGFAAGYTPKDGDDSGLVYDVLKRFGRAPSLDVILSYEEDDHFRCYEIEANPSISANIHILSALREAELPAEHPAVQKALGFLYRAQTIRLFWFDKWHSSPYYATTHLVIAAAGYAEWLVDNAVYWIIETQNRDGSWGYYMSTAEETAYCLQALVTWKRHGHDVSDDALQRGAAWLLKHLDEPIPPLWIGKSLYCPVYVVQSAILSALMLVAQG
ncbi:MAG: cyclase, partial [Anaerolineae bacterium]|nr:cyclase [Anaerolineae bacterium]